MNPATPEQQFQQALHHHKQGQLPQAESLYRQLLKELPNHATIHCNLGNVLKDQGRADEAITSYETAIRLSPDYAQPLFNLGLLLKQLNRLDEAAASFRGAIAISPNYFDALNSLGTTLMAIGQSNEALDALNRAVQLNPTSVPALTNLGGLLGDLARTDEAAAVLQRALTINPNFAGAAFNLGHALECANRLDDAAIAYRKAIELQPTFAPAYSDLGTTLKNLGQLDEAIAVTRRAMQLDPTDSHYHSNLILAMHYHPSFDAAAILAEQKIWDTRFARLPILPHQNSTLPHRPLRIGYVSADLWNHPLGRNLLPLFQQHDTRAVEIFFYSNSRKIDEVTKSIQACSSHWRNISRIPDDQAAEMIRSDSIDILVDLSQHMGSNRLPLFALKPAPVQLCFAAYPGGTGLYTMDYHISDPHLDPPTSDSHYHEKTLRLPDSYWLYNPMDNFPINELPAQTNGHITFGCLNNFCKINTNVLNIWGQIMNATPNSHIIVLADTPSQRRRLEQFLPISPDRITTTPRTSPQEYMCIYNRIDLALDTIPYNGHTTSLDAFWMGVPVITLVGKDAPARGGLSLLNNLQLPELAAHDETQFVNLATSLANDLPRLTNLRQTLRQKMLDSPLLNPKKFCLQHRNPLPPSLANLAFILSKAKDLAQQ